MIICEFIVALLIIANIIYIVYKKQKLKNMKQTDCLESYKFINNWSEDLIWCPSQINSNEFVYNNNVYYIYLRWRHENPWTADLIQIKEDDWTSIDIPFFKDDEYIELEKYIESNIEKILEKMS